jgi:hypothetical protein
MMFRPKETEAIQEQCLTIEFSPSEFVDWLKRNKDPFDVFGKKETIEHVRINTEPHEVFAVEDLEAWARENEFVKEGGAP